MCPFFVVVFVLGTVPASALGLLLAQHSRITLSMLGRPYGMPGSEPGLAIYKAKYPTLTPRIYFCLVDMFSYPRVNT